MVNKIKFRNNFFFRNIHRYTHMLHKLNKKLFGYLFKMGHYFYQYLIYQNYDM